MRIQPKCCNYSSASLNRRLTTPGKERRGAAAVEFAIVLPVLVTVLLGVTDFGRVSYTSISLANAARAGAAYASMNPYSDLTQAAWTTAITSAVTDELSQSSGFNTNAVTLTATNTVEASGLSRVSVQVTYPFSTLVNWPGLPSSINIQQTVVVRCIR